MAQPSRSKRKSQSGAAGSYSDVYKKSATNSAIQATSGPATSGAAVATMATTPVREANLRASDDVDWGGEYGYVIADLKYLGIITAVITGAIIVVGIFI